MGDHEHVYIIYAMRQANSAGLKFGGLTSTSENKTNWWILAMRRIWRLCTLNIEWPV
jgi:hypothetical protein